MNKVTEPTLVVSSEDSTHALNALFAKHNADRHMRLYLRERNGALIWKAYLEYRQVGLPVPENILLKLDQWAAQLQLASSDADVAFAIDMANISGAPQRKLRLQAELRRDMVEDYRIRVHELSQSPTKARKAVAERFGKTPSNIGRIVSQWGGIAGEPRGGRLVKASRRNRP